MQKTRKWWQAALAVSLALALTVPAFAQGQSGSPEASGTGGTSPSGSAGMKASEQVGKAMGDEATTEADRTLNQRIRQALSENTALAASAQNVHIKTDKGEVTLPGLVKTEKEKTDIGAKVQQVTGATKLNNQLQVAPNLDRVGATSGSMSPSASGSMGSSHSGSTGSASSSASR